MIRKLSAFGSIRKEMILTQIDQHFELLEISDLIAVIDTFQILAEHLRKQADVVLEIPDSMELDEYDSFCHGLENIELILNRALCILNGR